MGQQRRLFIAIISSGSDSSRDRLSIITLIPEDKQYFTLFASVYTTYLHVYCICM